MLHNTDLEPDQQSNNIRFTDTRWRRLDANGPQMPVLE